MSAACAPNAAPNIIAITKCPRIITLPPNPDLRGDYDLLTLINREAVGTDRKMKSAWTGEICLHRFAICKNRQTKT
jgi:hypothetical protein